MNILRNIFIYVQPNELSCSCILIIYTLFLQKLNTETLDEQVPRLHKQVESSIGTKSDKASSIGNSFLLDTMTIHQDGVMENEANYNHGVSQYSLSSSRSVSPSRYLMEK